MNCVNVDKMQKGSEQYIKHHPTEEDVQNLNASILQLQDEMKKYDQLFKEEGIEREQFIIQQIHSLDLPDDDNEIYTNLVQTKFKVIASNNYKLKYQILETLIFVLKKKIARLEQTSEELRELVANFGSLENLLKENERLKKENENYRWMEKRFNSHELLKREHLFSEDIPFLRSLIFALQNELLYV